MDKELLQKKLHKFFELARLHSWCREIYYEIDELERLNYPKKNSIINKIINEKLQSNDTPREELVLSSALLFKLTGQPGEITNLLFNKLRDKLFVKDSQFLMEQLFQDKYPVPNELTYDITERAFIDTKTAIKRALKIEKIMSTEGAVKTVLYFTLLLCMPKLNAENKAMLLILLSRIDAVKPANLETVIIDFFKKIKITEVDLEEIIESVNQEKQGEKFIIPQKKEEHNFNQPQFKPTITKIINNVLEVQKQASAEQSDGIKIKKSETGANIIKKNRKLKTEAERYASLKEPAEIKKTDSQIEKPSLFSKKHEITNENTIKEESNNKKAAKKLKKEIADLNKKAPKISEPVQSTRIRKANEVKTPPKQFYEIFFRPLSGSLKDLIDSIMSGKIFRKKESQIQKVNKKIIPGESGNTEGTGEKVDKRLSYLLRKIQMTKLPKIIKISFFGVIAVGLAVFLITRIVYDKDDPRSITEQTPGSEENLLQKTPGIDERDSSSGIEKNESPFYLERSGDHIIWEIQENENIWKFFLFLQNNTLPFEAIIYENETWSQFLTKLQGLNPDIGDLNYIYPGETIKVY